MQASVLFAKATICAKSIVWRNYLFPDSKSDTESNRAEIDEVRKAYQKGRLDILCSLAEHEIISLETGAYMAGMSKQSFEKVLQDWQYEWMDDVDE